MISYAELNDPQLNGPKTPQEVPDWNSIVSFWFGFVGSFLLVAATALHLDASDGAEDWLNFLSAVFLFIFFLTGLKNSFQVTKMVSPGEQQMNQQTNGKKSWGSVLFQ